MQKSAENRENKNSQAYRLKNIVVKSKGMVIVGGIFLLLLFSIMIITNRISSEQLEDTMYLNQYRLGSKALTAAVQAYSVTGDQQYYDAYMKELNEDKNRDIAWAGLEENDIKAEEWDKLNQIAGLSNGLVPLEEAAMSSVADGDMQSAIDYVFGDQYGETIQQINAITDDAITTIQTRMERRIREAKMKAEVIDVTLPAQKNNVGHRHPNTIALEEVERIFIGMGYEVVEGPEVEYDKYNFELLNIPANHPAKDEQDTFYITKDILLRTQTSPVQARIMEKGKLPIRILSAGRVFRADEVDATHSPSFHQVEGLVVDKNITMADLKGTLAQFAKEFFGEKTQVKFRPHHFPFTEPSAEVDITCFKCGGKGCRMCKGSGWIEILGCGMVHPHVLEMCGIDPKEYQGFAFGIGLERVTLLKYEIDDMRLLYENDTRFLGQF